MAAFAPFTPRRFILLAIISCIALLKVDSQSGATGWDKPARMCTMKQLENHWLKLERHMNDSTPMFDGGPVVKPEYIATLLKNRTAGPIPTLSPVGQSELARRLVLANVPFVIRAVPAVTVLQDRWSQGYMTSALGEMQVMVQQYKDKKLRYTDSKKRARSGDTKVDLLGATKRTRSTIAELFDEVVHNSAARSMLYGATSIPQSAGGPFRNDATDYNLTASMFDAFLPLVREHLNFQNPTLRFGFDPIEYATHFDWHSNFLSQVSGEKRVVLMHPHESQYLYWQRNHAHPHHRQVHVVSLLVVHVLV